MPFWASFELNAVTCAPPLAGSVPKEDYIRQRSGDIQKSKYDDFFATLPHFIESKYFDLCIEIIEGILAKDNLVENEQVLELLFLVFADAFNSIKPSFAKHSDRFDVVFKYIDANLNKKITLEELASLLSYTPNHFINVFKKNIGVTPFEYIKTKRLKKGESLLVTTDLSISAIAEKCGFSDTSFFVKQFKQMYGITPTALRKTRSYI